MLLPFVKTELFSTIEVGSGRFGIGLPATEHKATLSWNPATVTRIGRLIVESIFSLFSLVRSSVLDFRLIFAWHSSRPLGLIT